MTKTNLSRKQKQTFGHREQICGGQGEKGWEVEGGWTRSLGLADAN